MKKYHMPQPQKIRNIESSFAWIDHRLVRNGYLQVMTKAPDYLKQINQKLAEKLFRE